MRLEAIACTLAIASATAGSMWWTYRAHLARKPVVFTQTLIELEKDARALDPVPRSGDPAP
jgi:hypothetical protein